MNIKCGIDIIEIDRIKENIDSLGERFLNRIYTNKEIGYCESKKNQKYQHYAARFAAKEAVFKAISEQFDNKYEISWTDIEILNEKDGKPKVNFYNIKIEKLENIDISISHCREYAVASVVALYN